MDLDLHSAMEALKARGVRFDDAGSTLEQVARANGITPMTVYGIIRRFGIASESVPITGLTAEEIEARYAGSGLGRISLGELCKKVGVDQATAMSRLAEAGISAEPQDNVRKLAERSGATPIDILKIMVIPGFRSSR